MSSDTMSRRRITGGGQKWLIGSLILCSVVFAVGFSIALFGLTSRFLVTTFDQIMVLLVGLVMIVGSSLAAYFLLS